MRKIDVTIVSSVQMKFLSTKSEIVNRATIKPFCLKQLDESNKAANSVLEHQDLVVMDLPLRHEAFPGDPAPQDTCLYNVARLIKQDPKKPVIAVAPAGQDMRFYRNISDLDIDVLVGPYDLTKLQGDHSFLAALRQVSFPFDPYKGQTTRPSPLTIELHRYSDGKSCLVKDGKGMHIMRYAANLLEIFAEEHALVGRDELIRRKLRMDLLQSNVKPTECLRQVKLTNRMDAPNTHKSERVLDVVCTGINNAMESLIARRPIHSFKGVGRLLCPRLEIEIVRHPAPGG